MSSSTRRLVVGAVGVVAWHVRQGSVLQEDIKQFSKVMLASMAVEGNSKWQLVNEQVSQSVSRVADVVGVSQ